MNQTYELEFLVKTAERKIAELDTYKFVPFPSDSQPHLEIAIQAIMNKQKIPEATIGKMGECEEIAKQNLNSLHSIFNEGIIKDETLGAIIIKKYFGNDMHRFLIHDGFHLIDLYYRFLDIFRFIPGDSTCFPEVRIDPDFFLETATKLNESSTDLIELFKYPWQLVHYMSQSYLGNEVQPVKVNLRKILEQVATSISGRYFYRIVQERNVKTPLKKSILIEGEDITIETYPGIAESITHNNMKNSAGKFEDEEEKAMGDDSYKHEVYSQFLDSIKDERVVYGSCHELNGNYVALVFSDTGSPMNIQRMMSNLREKLMASESTTIDWVSPEMKEHLIAWSENDYAWNMITLEDISNAAFMAHMSGSEYSEKRIISGMGLFGARCLIEDLGGAVLYTTTFKDENPVFTYIIPKRPLESTLGAQNIRRNIIQGRQRVA